jgi:hypothetical protein
MARPLGKSLLLWTRTLHIYATMLALILLIFYSFTGFVMNHPAVFGIDDFKAADETLAEKMPEAARAGAGPEHEMNAEVYLRMHGAHGERTSFDDEPESMRVQFTGAGNKMEYVIDKADGKIDLHQETRGMLALMSDLHKGTGTGKPWRLIIDGTAIFLAFAALSGLTLWIALPKRRTLGLIALAVSLALCGGVVMWLRP